MLIALAVLVAALAPFLLAVATFIVASVDQASRRRIDANLALGVLDICKSLVGQRVFIRTRILPQEVYIGELESAAVDHLRLTTKEGTRVVLMVSPAELVLVAQIAEQGQDQLASLLEAASGGGGSYAH